jgi:hypothetical protein
MRAPTSPAIKHTPLDTSDLAAMKARARHSLLACEGAPEHVQAIMTHRTETLFALLIDRQR